ncbi:MAG: GTPase domain-containing protein [Verrucomicrobiota bacterium]
MAVINEDRREAVLKLVYCGTALGGKTSNLNHIHGALPSDKRGDMVSLATAADRTLFFDFLPVNAVEICGYQVKFQLYTVPGQIVYNATRQLVLKGVDGIVFVADSDERRLEENAESLRFTEQNLKDNGVEPTQLPTVLQYNKRDLPNAAPIENLRYLLNRGLVPRPEFESVATEGHQVFSTMDALTQLVLQRFESFVTQEGAKSGSKVAAS